MSDRFFVEPPISEDQPLRLTGPEAQHLTRVMRAQVGDRVTAFDGGGVEYEAEVSAVTRNDVLLRVISRRDVDRESPVSLTLAVALPKGDRQKWLVQKAVELGVARVIPLITERGVAQATASARKRMERTVVEASKQCGRNRLMQIHPPLDWKGLATLIEAEKPSHCLLAHPGGEAWPAIGQNSQQVFAAIGPEGGFTEAEVAQALEQGWRPIDLGPRILRIETAALKTAARLL